MDRENHLKVDSFFWNKEYNEVHKWIDGTFWKYDGKDPYRHWLDTHHLKAIKEKYSEFSMEYIEKFLNSASEKKVKK